jgi:hypothetical protein
VARLVLRALPLAGIVYPEPSPARLRCRAGRTVTTRARGWARSRSSRLRDYQWRRAAARRLEGGRTRRRLVHEEFDGSGGGGPIPLDWAALPASVDTETRLSRLTAWVLAAERAARPFALRIPGASLPVAADRDHRRAALTLLATFPAERRP